MYGNSHEEPVESVISLLEDALRHDTPITDGMKRDVWAWVGVNPARNSIVLYKAIIRHNDERIRKIELGWPPAIQADTAEGESAEKQAESPNIGHEYIKPVGIMFQ